MVVSGEGGASGQAGYEKLGGGGGGGGCFSFRKKSGCVPRLSCVDPLGPLCIVTSVFENCNPN